MLLCSLSYLLIHIVLIDWEEQDMELNAPTGSHTNPEL